VNKELGSSFKCLFLLETSMDTTTSEKGEERVSNWSCRRKLRGGGSNNIGFVAFPRRVDAKIGEKGPIKMMDGTR